jgi:hypothetical protein
VRISDQRMCPLKFPVAQEILTPHHPHPLLKFSPKFVVCISMMQQAQARCLRLSPSWNGKLNVRRTPPVTDVWKKSTVYLVLPLGLLIAEAGVSARHLCLDPQFNSIGAPRSYGYEAFQKRASQLWQKRSLPSWKKKNRLASAIYCTVTTTAPSM